MGTFAWPRPMALAVGLSAAIAAGAAGAAGAGVLRPMWAHSESPTAPPVVENIAAGLQCPAGAPVMKHHVDLRADAKGAASPAEAVRRFTDRIYPGAPLGQFAVEQRGATAVMRHRLAAFALWQKDGGWLMQEAAMCQTAAAAWHDGRPE